MLWEDVQVGIGSLACGFCCGCLQLLGGPSLSADQVQHAEAGLPARPHSRIGSDVLQADQADIAAVVLAGDEVLEARNALLELLIDLTPLEICIS